MFVPRRIALVAAVALAASAGAASSAVESEYMLADDCAAQGFRQPTTKAECHAAVGQLEYSADSVYQIKITNTFNKAQCSGTWGYENSPPCTVSGVTVYWNNCQEDHGKGVPSATGATESFAGKPRSNQVCIKPPSPSTCDADNVPVLRELSKTTGVAGEIISIHGSWRKPTDAGAPDMQAMCHWWYNSKAYELYQAASMKTTGEIVCAVPAKPSTAADGDAVHVSVTVWRDGENRQKNECWSSQGASVPSTASRGRSLPFLYGKPAHACTEANRPRIKNIAVENTHRLDSGPGNTVHLSGEWRYHRAGTQAVCHWWYNGRAYKTYQPALQQHWGTISCEVPQRITTMSDSPAPPPGAEVQVTVSVWDTRSDDHATTGMCMSHFGAAVPDDTTPGRYATFKYNVPRVPGRCVPGLAAATVCAAYAHGICGKPPAVTSHPYTHLCKWSEPVSATTIATTATATKPRDCSVCAREFEAEGGCAHALGANVMHLVPEGCLHCEEEAKRHCKDKASKPLVCSSVGDPHFKTFANRRFDFYGTGLYWLANTSHVAVQALHVKAGRASANTGVAVLDRATGEVVTFRTGADGRVAATSNRVLAAGSTAASTGVHTTTACGGACTIELTKSKTEFVWTHRRSGLIVKGRGFRGAWMNVYVVAQPFALWRGVSGLCAGKTTDSTTPVREEDAVYGFRDGESYATHHGDDNGDDSNGGDACDTTQGLHEEAMHACKGTGDMTKDCVKDVCATGDLGAAAVIKAAVKDIKELEADPTKLDDVTTTAAPKPRGECRPVAAWSADPHMDSKYTKICGAYGIALCGAPRAVSGSEYTPRCEWVATEPSASTTTATPTAPCDPASAAQQQLAMLDALEGTAKAVASSLAGMVESVKELDGEAGDLQKELDTLNAAIADKGC